MAQWIIQRRATGGDPWEDTGEVYDDSCGGFTDAEGNFFPLSVADYITMIAARDGWLYQSVAA